jgi:diaminopimelate decarboxylase
MSKMPRNGEIWCIYDIVQAGKNARRHCYFAMEVDMPDVDISERVLILSAGDYTASYASQFGGVPISKLLLVQEHIGEWLGIC